MEDEPYEYELSISKVEVFESNKENVTLEWAYKNVGQ